MMMGKKGLKVLFVRSFVRGGHFVVKVFFEIFLFCTTNLHLLFHRVKKQQQQEVVEQKKKKKKRKREDDVFFLSSKKQRCFRLESYLLF